MKRSTGYWILILLVAAVLGSLFGEIIGQLFGSGAIARLFQSNVEIGLAPPATLDLFALQLSFGFKLKANLCTVLGIVVALWLLGRK